MRSMIDFSSWSTALSTLAGLLLVTCLMMGVRLLFMQTIQKRRERENRQINERLKTLIAAYKTLGGSFTGTLEVHPTHMRDLRMQQNALEQDDDESDAPVLSSTERQRRVRDAVEAALSDVILLGTEEQVGLAVQAAQDMTAGRSIHTKELVVSLRNYVRDALDLEPIPASLIIPAQGPLRPNTTGGANKRAGSGNDGGSNAGGAARGGNGGGQGGSGGMGAMGLGMGMGAGAQHLGSTADSGPDDSVAPPR
ncbi:hypothetical protein G7048_24005 [Diaphorobacter sp. HDW4B]|uniref:hypothetical protein n=1 Tax=Diaphorobacter sp. HDW4B TaxID=2714925 RepID=UPI0014088DD9|nr:hypothetical protein [Diaphorobacter sp. HDW4B]QIL73144.1 hypothetical protein G7048_24005 [Diaphorobacter sp. HDW4B]